MTAEALLCRMYLGWDMSHVGLRTGVDHLVRDTANCAGLAVQTVMPS